MAWGIVLSEDLQTVRHVTRGARDAFPAQPQRQLCCLLPVQVVVGGVDLVRLRVLGRMFRALQIKGIISLFDSSQSRECLVALQIFVGLSKRASYQAQKGRGHPW